jgi:PD-(D/E)XK nuclease superfamily protein
VTIGPLAAALAESMAEDRNHRGEKPTADSTRARISDALKCERQLAFGWLRVPKPPLPPEVLAAFEAGEHHHTRIQGVLAAKFGATLEVPVSYRPDLDLSGHADAIYPVPEDGSVRVAEIKTMKKWGFEHAQKEGPKLEHVTQAAMYGMAPTVGANSVHMIYVSKDDAAIAEWTLSIYDDEIDGVLIADHVRAELDRIRRVFADVDAGLVPWRRIPGFGTVKDPSGPKGDNHPWNCDYCGWRPLCARLPASRCTIATLNADEVIDAEVVA